MQNSRRCELVEAIRHAVATFREMGQRFLNKDVVEDTVIETNGPFFEELGRSLAREKLFDVTRRVMKSAAEMTATGAVGLGVRHFGFAVARDDRRADRRGTSSQRGLRLGSSDAGHA